MSLWDTCQARGGLENRQADHRPGAINAPQSPPPPNTHENQERGPVHQGLPGREETFKEAGVHFALLLNSVKTIFKLVLIYFKAR